MMLLCVSMNEIIDGQISSLLMIFAKNINFIRVKYIVYPRCSRCRSR